MLDYIKANVAEQKNVMSQLVSQFIIIVTMVILIGLISAYVISGSISNPIKKLRDATNEAAEGNLDIQINIKSNDESGELASAFNYMIGSLKKSKEEIESETSYQLSSLENKIKREIEDITKQISDKKYPNRSSADQQSRLYATMLVNNAHKDFELKPNNLQEKLKRSLEMKENEYFFELVDLYLNDKETPQLVKIKVQDMYKELDSKKWRARGYPFFPHDAHFNKLGNQIVSTIITDYMKKEELVESSK